MAEYDQAEFGRLVAERDALRVAWGAVRDKRNIEARVLADEVLRDRTDPVNAVYAEKYAEAVGTDLAAHMAWLDASDVVRELTGHRLIPR